MSRRRRRMGGAMGGGLHVGQGLSAWWDFSDLGTLTLADVDKIVSISDKSGNGNLLVQSTGTARATTVDNSLNGKRVAAFDGNDSYPIPSALYGLGAGANTAFIVCNGTQNTTQEAVLEMGTTTNDTWNFRLDADAVSGRIAYANINAAALTNAVKINGVTTGVPHIYTMFRSGTTQSLSVDGATATTNTNAVNGTATQGFVGANKSNTAIKLNGMIAEIIIYNRALTAAEITQVNRYLSFKYGITLA